MTSLRSDQRRKANSLFAKLKKQPKEWFEKNNIIKCELCEGSGLQANKIPMGGYSWDGRNYCEECYGIGYLGIATGMQFDDGQYACKKCQTVGCPDCTNGFVDWITHAMAI